MLPPFLPAGVLGSSQVGALPILQVASLGGIGAVSALIVAGNAALAQLAVPSVPLARRVCSLGAVVALVLTATMWGAARIDRVSSLSPTHVQVLIVDGAARKASESTLQRYISATPRNEPPPALVVWPESALLVDLEQDRATWLRLKGFVEQLGAPLVTGGMGSAIDRKGNIVRFNSVHFLQPGHAMRSYHKRLLVPFAEAWPSWLGSPPAAIEPVAAGRDLVVFGNGEKAFGTLVCFEIIDAGSARELALRGARFLLSVNNDVWFPADPPHQSWIAVRAVETGRPIVRASNGATSSIVDPAGRNLASARSTERPIVLSGVMPEPLDTVYIRTGEVLWPLCIVIVLAGLLPRTMRFTERSSRSGSYPG
jgi:apolipoprotein N-acyltransferase